MDARMDFFRLEISTYQIFSRLASWALVCLSYLVFMGESPEMDVLLQFAIESIYET
jgi:hypothetical protein